MTENLFNSSHKATNEEYRDGYERTFGKKDKIAHVGDIAEDGEETEVFNGPVVGGKN